MMRILTLTFVFGLLISLPTPVGAETVPVGKTGLSLAVPEGWRLLAPEGDAALLLSVTGPGGEHTVRALRGAADATGQALAEDFETRMRSLYGGFRLVGQERVQVGGKGAQYRRYEGRDGKRSVLVHALILVRGPVRIVLYAAGGTEPSPEARGILLSVSGTPAAGTEPDPPPVGPPEGPSEPEPEPGKWIEIRGTDHRIRSPAGWKGGPHAATRGLRIVSPDRGSIIDVAVFDLPDGERRPGAAGRVADDFEKHLLAEGTGWRRIEARRETVNGNTAPWRRYEGRPAGLACDFIVLAVRSGSRVFLAKAIYPTRLRERHRAAVAACLRSLARR